MLFFMSSKETLQTSHTKKLESPKENVNITNIIHSVVSLTLLSFPCIRFNKLKFIKKIENLKFHSLKVYFRLTSFTIFKIPQVAFNYNKSKCICQRKNTSKTCCSIAWNLIDIFHKLDSSMYNKIYYMIFVSSFCMCETLY